MSGTRSRLLLGLLAFALIAGSAVVSDLGAVGVAAVPGCAKDDQQANPTGDPRDLKMALGMCIPYRYSTVTVESFHAAGFRYAGMVPVRFADGVVRNVRRYLFRQLTVNGDRDSAGLGLRLADAGPADYDFVVRARTGSVGAAGMLTEVYGEIDQLKIWAPPLICLINWAGLAELNWVSDINGCGLQMRFFVIKSFNDNPEQNTGSYPVRLNSAVVTAVSQ